MLQRNIRIWIRSISKRGSEYLNGIIDRIKLLRLYDNSIILVLSDHGSSIGDKIGEKMYGSYLYDYTIRCFLYMIGKDLPKNMEINNLVRNIDVLPTILDILKIRQKRALSQYKQIQGKSFLKFAKGKFDERTAYSETGGLGGYTPSPKVHNVKSVRTNKWKLIYNETSKKKELYDLERDPKEEKNLFGTGLEIENEMNKKLEEQKTPKGLKDDNR